MYLGDFFFTGVHLDTKTAQHIKKCKCFNVYCRDNSTETELGSSKCNSNVAFVFASGPFIEISHSQSLQIQLNPCKRLNG